MDMIINKINNLYEIKKKYIKKYIDSDLKYTYTFTSVNDTDFFVDIFHNNKHILKAEYEQIGIYNLLNSTWTWAWNNSYIEKPCREKSKLIKKFSDEIIKVYKSDYNLVEKYIYYCTNGSFYIVPKTADLLLKLALYVTKGEWIISIKNDENYPTKIEYILLKKITQLKI